MKKEYSIGEICQLYQLGPDSLRYYEKKGLLHPTRKPNGYRVYTLSDIWRLNIIKDLRKLDFSIPQIKNYLENRTLNHSISMLEKEIKIIQSKIKPLELLEKKLHQKLTDLKKLKSFQLLNTIHYQKIDDRKIIFVDGFLAQDEAVDLAFRELEKTDDETLSLVGNQDMGVFIDEKSFQARNYTSYHTAFFFVQDQEKTWHRIIKGGMFACFMYQGPYSQSQVMFEKIVADIYSKNYRITGKAMEIYRLDIHTTADENEFLTEIQIPVSTI
ncbi:DNA-binding transcriptional regulator, MerR family [Tindallia magadiensis]|uniref:DNA-binding transcriptional regulator, MerR family n=1 Tax=Tindallia magadiensis TaxID=69895 RepID=A0A1I3FFM0_9FIRM|nr:MerR family transcriptional regulator [Tindallia magadiensis]SFI09892.1 DNA-binding transcriptional regulator, MerR family [Tindallia magadiensis]